MRWGWWYTRFSADRYRSSKIKTPLLSTKSWKVNDPGDLEERKGRGSRMIYGGCWNVVGDPNPLTVQLSRPYFSAWEM